MTVQHRAGELWRQQNLRNAPFWTVLTIEVGALVYTAISPQHWLRAVGVMSIGLFLAAIARGSLTDEQAGSLRVRRRSFDVLSYLVFGVLAVTFGLALPQR